MTQNLEFGISLSRYLFEFTIEVIRNVLDQLSAEVIWFEFYSPKTTKPPFSPFFKFVSEQWNLDA